MKIKLREIRVGQTIEITGPKGETHGFHKIITRSMSKDREYLIFASRLPWGGEWHVHRNRWDEETELQSWDTSDDIN